MKIAISVIFTHSFLLYFFGPPGSKYLSALGWKTSVWWQIKVESNPNWQCFCLWSTGEIECNGEELPVGWQSKMILMDCSFDLGCFWARAPAAFKGSLPVIEVDTWQLTCCVLLPWLPYWKTNPYVNDPSNPRRVTKLPILELENAILFGWTRKKNHKYHCQQFQAIFRETSETALKSKRNVTEQSVNSPEQRADQLTKSSSGE